MDFIDIPIGRDEKLKREPQARYPHSKEVFSLWGKYPANWNMNTSQLRAAENLYAEHSIEDIKGALAFALSRKDEDYCPKVSTPYDLDSKWAKLEDYNKKL